MEIWGGNESVDKTVTVPGIDAWVYSRPYAGQERGGDIHFVSMCGAGAISRFSVADVSGHGNMVGEVANHLRALMRKHINNLDQTSFVQALNREFSALAADGTFATALLTTYFAPSDHLITCNAGHPTPLLYRARQGQWYFLKHDMPDHVDHLANLPLGVIDPTPYYQFAIALERGDLVLMYTDSLVEAKDPDGRLLGEEQLLQIIERLDTQSPETFCPRLLKALEAYRGGHPSDDDITLLLLHHNADNPPQQSFGEKMKVIGKMLGLIKI
ncbi:MAG: serine/threonine-protein phosphatase [Phycisphaerales bacterium]|nr:serine/threonine-protein phosphatase [Phycisphaerales bacterium]